MRTPVVEASGWAKCRVVVSDIHTWEAAKEDIAGALVHRCMQIGDINVLGVKDPPQVRLHALGDCTGGIDYVRQAMHRSAGRINSIQHFARQYDYIFMPAPLQFPEEVPCVGFHPTELAVPKNVKNPHRP
jgi:hypothetical protein